ncbi:hypothetical protein [uncultured Thermanaerothrix sp.]|uniref:hypothetical protein n=1 Tax=uncultured Thermanaerothrix sp. TaxID=1195149 RepID=UPI002625CC3B|nr:hypothetical protein [uncultured Thermanaerothrix sp.]
MHVTPDPTPVLSTQAELQRVLRWWWVIVLAALLGAFGGWLAHAIKPPIYEAQAVFSATIDYTRTGLMTQFEQDQALNAVGHLIASNEVIERVINQLQGEGSTLTIADLRRMGTVERQVDAFVLRLRTSDPQEAARLANLWAGEADAVLADAQTHALKAASLAQYMRSIETCLQRAVMVAPATALCPQQSLEDLQALLATVGQQFQTERQASRNLFPGLSIQWVESASPPTQPVQYGRNDLMLVGALIGWVLGLVLVETLPFFRRFNYKDAN